MNMRRLISKQEFDKTMDDYSQLYCTEPPLKNMGVSEHHVFEPPKLSRPTVSDPFESPASAFHAAGTYMDLLQQHDEHQVVNLPTVTFPLIQLMTKLAPTSGTPCNHL
jgi:hypothetical protein